MIYSNACYAPGAGEGFDEPADEETAAERVSAYSAARRWPIWAHRPTSRPTSTPARRTWSARCSTSPDLPYGEVFASEPNFVRRWPGAPAARAARRGRDVAASVGLLRGRKPTTGTPLPAIRRAPWPAGSGALTLGPAAPDLAEIAAVDGLATGMASSYPESIGWEGRVRRSRCRSSSAAASPRESRTWSSSARTAASACPSSTPARATSARRISGSRTSRTPRGRLVTDMPLEEGAHRRRGPPVTGRDPAPEHGHLALRLR